jgi:uncharacterized membrane protein YbhN (UPF0104 family)
VVLWAHAESNTAAAVDDKRRCAGYKSAPLVKKLLSIFISVAILAVIYWRIDFAKIIENFARCDRLWMAVSLLLVVPLTLFTAWRLQQLMPSRGQLGFGEANRLILAASVLNLVLPSKMGDIAKAWFMKDRSGLSGSLTLSLVVFEKSCDMLSLLAWCVFGLAWVKLSDAKAMDAFAPPQWLAEMGWGSEAFFWLSALFVAGSLALGILLLASRSFADWFFVLAGRFAPGKVRAKIAKLGGSWAEMHEYFWSDKARLAKVTLTSLFIWFLHLLQIWLFIIALRAATPFLANLALSPLAILAGLLPIPTFGGAGTRDGALIVLYSPYFAAETAAALGVLCTARYLLPAFGGVPFVGQYFRQVREMQKDTLTQPA